MKNVLIITYNWPPTVGISVQRWLKLSKYLLRQHVNPIILTTNEKYGNYGLGTNNSFTEEISRELIVYRTKTFEPLRAILKKIRVKSKHPEEFYFIEAKRGFLKFIQSIRSNLFFPDAFKGWNKYALKKALQIINDHNIKTVITTSPPHSSQLIGLKLKESLDINWIADFRDPWTDSRWYSISGHSYFSDLKNKSLEKKVLLNADKILTVGDGLKHLLLNKCNIYHTKISVIPNGYDNEDYITHNNCKSKEFNICYTGTMDDFYEPYVFFNVLKEVQEVKSNIELRINLVGYITRKIKRQILKTGLDCKFISSVPHKDAIEYQKGASLLLLIIPNIINANVILSGKLFEYLATRNNIICIGPKSGDAAKIIDECNCGKTFNRTEKQEIKNYINKSINNFITNVKFENNEDEIKRYSREYQAKLIKKEITKLEKRSQ